jgi:hypothetical protein
MSIRCPTVPPLDMFTVRIQDARDTIVQYNETLKNPSEIFTEGSLEVVTREIRTKLTDIQTQFDKLVSDNATLVSSGGVSESFALKKGSFEVVKTAGNQLLGQIELVKEAVIMDLFTSQERNQSASFPPQAQVLPPKDPEFSSDQQTSSRILPPLYRRRISSLDLSEESSALSFSAEAAPPLPWNDFTPLLLAAGSIQDLPRPFVLGAPALDPGSIDDPSVNIQPEGKRKRQAPVTVQGRLPLALEALDPSIAANPKKHRTALRLQKPKDPLLLKPVSSLNKKEKEQILTTLQVMLKDIPEDIKELTSDEVDKFGIAFGSEEYVRYTELQQLKLFDKDSDQVKLIELKIIRGLQGIRWNF